MALMAIKISVTVFPLHLSWKWLCKNTFLWLKQNPLSSSGSLLLSVFPSTVPQFSHSQVVISPDSEDIPDVKGCKLHNPPWSILGTLLLLGGITEPAEGMKERASGQQLLRTSRKLPTFCLSASLLQIPTKREVRPDQRNNHTLNKTQR